MMALDVTARTEGKRVLYFHTAIPYSYVSTSSYFQPRGATDPLWFVYLMTFLWFVYLMTFLGLQSAV